MNNLYMILFLLIAHTIKAQQVEWVINFDDHEQGASKIYSDNNDNLFIAGPENNYGRFRVSLFNSSGSRSWIKEMIKVNAVFPNGNGKLLVSGQFGKTGDTLDIDGYTTPGNENWDFFIAELTQAGILERIRVFDNTADQTSSFIKRIGSDIFLSGYSYGTIHYDSVTTNSDTCTFIMKLDTSFNVSGIYKIPQFKGIDGARQGGINDILRESNGNYYVTGGLYTTYPPIFIERFDPAFNPIAYKSIPGLKSNRVLGSILLNGQTFLMNYSEADQYELNSFLSDNTFSSPQLVNWHFPGWANAYFNCGRMAVKDDSTFFTCATYFKHYYPTTVVNYCNYSFTDTNPEGSLIARHNGSGQVEELITFEGGRVTHTSASNSSLYVVGEQVSDMSLGNSNLTLDPARNGFIIKYNYLLSRQAFKPEESLKVYPNPASDFLSIEGAALNDIELYDAMSRRIEIVVKNNSVDVSSYPAGVYIIRNGNKAIKFVKQWE